MASKFFYVASTPADIETTPKAEVLQTVLYTMPEYNNGLYVSAMIKNTSDIFIKLDPNNCSFDIEDQDGNFLYNLNYLQIAPCVLPPDEIGYLAVTELSDDIDLKKCHNVKVNLSYDSVMAISENMLVENAANLGEYSGYFYATPGRVSSSFGYDIANITPYTAFFDKNEKFLGVNICHPISNIPANGKVGFKGESGAPIPKSAFSKDDIGTIKPAAVFIREVGGN